MSRHEKVSKVLREHQRTTGMAVTMGVTCACGHWATGYRGDMLAEHQADMVLAVLDEE